MCGVGTVIFDSYLTDALILENHLTGLHYLDIS